jgi:hypothetical protein
MGVLLIFLLIISTASAGFAEAVSETLLFHFEKSIFKNKDPKFWNPLYAHFNRYKDDNVTPRFFLSTSLLSPLTDAQTLFKTLGNVLVVCSIIIIAYISPNVPVFSFLMITTKILSGVFLKNWLKAKFRDEKA